MRTTLRLLGTPALEVGPDRHPLPATRPGWLLAYLGARGGWVTRSQLAYLFRADSPESVARHYVRNLLNRARRLPHVSGLAIEPTRCRWEIDTDMGRFQRAIRTKNWFEALSCYQGRFLDGLMPVDAPVFENWLQATRDELHADWRHATLQYAADQESSARHDVAAWALGTFLEHDSLDEDVLQAYLRNAYLAGNREQALAAAGRYVAEIAQEMDLAPLPETLELIRDIRHGDEVQPVDHPRSHARRWTDALGEEHGELQTLIALLKDPRNRLQTTFPSKRGADETVIISRQVDQSGVVQAAIVDLAESLLVEGHHTRAVELMVLVMSQVSRDDSLLIERVDRIWDQVAPHVSDEMLRDVRMRW